MINITGPANNIVILSLQLTVGGNRQSLVSHRNPMWLATPPLIINAIGQPKANAFSVNIIPIKNKTNPMIRVMKLRDS